MTKIVNTEIRITNQEVIAPASNNPSSSTIPLNGSNLTGNVDVLENNNTPVSNDNNTPNIREEGVVNAKLTDIGNKYGLNKDQILTIIQEMTNKTFQDLLKLENKDYNNLVIGLDKILGSCLVNGSLDDTKLSQAKRDYKIATLTGWSLNGFFKQQQNVEIQSISERLEDLNITGGVTEENIEKFFGEVLLCNITDENRETEYKKQLQTFGRILVNTKNPEEAALLATAIDRLYRTNIVDAVNATLTYAEKPEIRREVALAVLDDYEEIVTTAIEEDPNAFMSTEDSQNLSHLIFENLSVEDIETRLPQMQSDAERFISENKEILDIILNKKEEELSEEELIIKREYENLHVGKHSGAITGIANNKNSKVIEKREEILTTLSKNAKEISEATGNEFYKNIMTKVVEFVKLHPESLQIPVEDFNQLMDKVTENIGTTKFSEFAKTINIDNQNLSEPTFTNPKPTSSTESPRGEFGFSTRELAGIESESRINLYMTNSLELEEPILINSELVSTNNTEKNNKPTSIVDISKGHIAEFYSYVSDEGLYKTVAEIYSNFSDITNQAVLGAAKKLYSMLTPSFQEKILRNLTSSEAFSELLSVTNDDVILNLKRNFSNSYKNQFLGKVQKEVQENSERV